MEDTEILERIERVARRVDELSDRISALADRSSLKLGALSAEIHEVGNRLNVRVSTLELRSDL